MDGIVIGNQIDDPGGRIGWFVADIECATAIIVVDIIIYSYILKFGIYTWCFEHYLCWCSPEFITVYLEINSGNSIVIDISQKDHVESAVRAALRPNDIIVIGINVVPQPFGVNSAGVGCGGIKCVTIKSNVINIGAGQVNYFLKARGDGVTSDT